LRKNAAKRLKVLNKAPYLTQEKNRLERQMAEGQLIAEAMQVIGQALASELDYERVVRNVADFAYRLVNAQFVYVFVPESDNFRLVAMAGHDGDRLNPALGARYFSPEPYSPLTKAFEQKSPVIIADAQSETTPASWQTEAQAKKWRAMVAVPLLTRNLLMGVLAAYAPEPEAFDANDVVTLTSLASQAAVAIQNAQLFAELEAQREALHQVSLRLVNAQEEERRRISRELHDELGQALTALKINLDVARRALPADASPKLVQSVHEAGILAVQTLEAARNLSLELHPAILDDLGLVAALRWEVDRYEQRTGMPVHFRADLSDVALRPELEITIYRIIIEALTNVARHAHAEHISVQLQVEKGQFMVTIEDDGRGFDAQSWFDVPTKRQSLGLISMRERAGLLGGELEVISTPGCGAKIRAKLPINN
jgi:signal transduction histidine kinase